MTLKSEALFEEKLTLGSKKDKEFGEFSPKHSKVQKLHFDGLFLPKVYEV